MKIGLMSVCAADLDLDAVLALARDSGLQGVELAAGYPGKLRGQPSGPEWHINVADLLASSERAALQAREAGLEIFSFASRCPPDDLGRFESLCRAAQSIGCPQVRIGVGPYDASLGFWGSIEQSRNQLAAAVDVAREYGVRTVIELHDHTMADGVLASYYLVRDMDPREVGVILDVGNARIFGWQPWPETVDILFDYLAHVHAKDVAWVHREGQWGTEPCAPGEGVVEWAELVKLLAARGYDGWIAIEDYRGGWCKRNPDWPTSRKVAEWKSFLDRLLAGR